MTRWTGCGLESVGLSRGLVAGEKRRSFTSQTPFGIFGGGHDAVEGTGLKIRHYIASGRRCRGRGKPQA
jgi:hypothetical protein